MGHPRPELGANCKIVILIGVICSPSSSKINAWGLLATRKVFFCFSAKNAISSSTESFPARDPLAFPILLLNARKSKPELLRGCSVFLKKKKNRQRFEEGRRALLVQANRLIGCLGLIGRFFWRKSRRGVERKWTKRSRGKRAILYSRKESV